MQRVLGACLIISGSTVIVMIFLQQEKLRQRSLVGLCDALRRMINELSRCRTPLPGLFRSVASETIDPVHSIFFDIAEELELQTLPDAGQCMLSVMEKHHPEPHLLGFLTDIGRCLGKVDLEGQVRELEMIHDRCVQVCAQLHQERKEKTQLVRTLGLCAGAVLVILLF